MPFKYSIRSLKECIQYINISLSSIAENYSQIFALFNSNDIDLKLQVNKTMISKVNQNEWKNDYYLHESVK